MRRPKPFVTILAEKLQTLYPDELIDVARWIEKIEAVRGAVSDPDFCALILAELFRLAPLYKHGDGVPIPRLRVCFSQMPRTTLDRALLDLEQRALVRLVPSKLPAPFVNPSEGLRSARGLLYFVAPADGA